MRRLLTAFFILTCFLPYPAFARSGLQISFPITLESLRSIESQAQAIQNLPQDAQHGSIVDNASGFNGSLHCWSAGTSSKRCELTVTESASDVTPGRFSHYIVLSFDLSSLSQTISFLERTMNAPSPIAKPQVFSPAFDSAILCGFDLGSKKKTCMLTVSSES